MSCVDNAGAAFVGAALVTTLGLVFHACVDGKQYSARHVRACEPFAHLIGFRDGDNEHTVCRDIDGGFQIREVK